MSGTGRATVVSATATYSVSLSDEDGTNSDDNDVLIAEAALALAKARAKARKNRWNKGTSDGSSSVAGSVVDAEDEQANVKKQKPSPPNTSAGSEKAPSSPATSTTPEEARIARMAAEQDARTAFEETLASTSAKLLTKGVKPTADVPMQFNFNSGVPPPPLPPKGGWSGLDKDRKKKTSAISPDNVAEIAEMVAKVELKEGVKPHGSVAAAVFPGIIPEALQQSSACAAVTPEEEADVGADVVRKADHSGEAFTCSQCRCEVAKASGFLLTEGPADWAGVLWGCCFACSEVFVQLQEGKFLYGNPSGSLPKSSVPPTSWTWRAVSSARRLGASGNDMPLK